MALNWTREALSDLERLYEFLRSVNQQAAAKVVLSLTTAPEILERHPRLGEQLFQFQPREVRRLLIGQYELRYEIADGATFILRIWHTRERR